MSILKNVLRHGNFTSSEAHQLTKMDRTGKKFGEAAMTYILEANIERYLDDAVDGEVESKPTSWGNLCEPRVHDLLPLDYTYTSNVTTQHPTIPFWVGSADGFKENINPEYRAVMDIKCPMTKKSFVQLVLPMYLGYTGIEIMLAIRNGFNHDGFEYPKHKDGNKYYWQIVSNAIINNCNYGELIVYMPYQSELLEIGNMAGDEPQYKWLKYSPDAVPFLKDGKFFNNLNIIRFEIPQADKDTLTELILKAGEMLIKPKDLQQAA